MATISKVWTSEATIYQTDAFQGSNSDVGSTEIFSSTIDLETNGYEGVQITIKVDFPDNPTDDLEVYFYASLDGTNWDNTAFYSITITNDTDPHQRSFIIKDFAYLRVGLKASGTTDTIDVQVKYKAWRWQSA